jgi:hypothetical protein
MMEHYLWKAYLKTLASMYTSHELLQLAAFLYRTHKTKIIQTAISPPLKESIHPADKNYFTDYIRGNHSRVFKAVLRPF